MGKASLRVYIFLAGIIVAMLYSYDAAASIDMLEVVLLVDTPKTKLRYPVPNDEYGTQPNQESPFNFKDPKNIDTEVVYDPETQRYTMYKKIGGKYYRYPLTFTLDEYIKYSMDKSIAEYWKSKFGAESISSGKAKTDKPLLTVESESFDRIFGGNAIDIKPQGSAELTFGVNSSRTDNPAISEKQRKISTFQFDQRIQLNVVGSVGEKLKINTSYNTEATFDFENQMKLDYTGYEDEIIKKIEAGNVSLPLNSSLISGSQSLFGIKTQLQFGRLTATTVFSQQKGKKSEINVQGGAQTQQFDFKADDYEANKHFFLTQYFRNQYDRLMAGVPNVNSPINITRIEVWVTNTNNTTDNTRNFLAFSDLGEDAANFTPGVFINDLLPDNIPQNGQNDIFSRYSNDPDVVGFSNATPKLTGDGFVAAVHFEKIESARKLPESAYSINRRLGFISLNQQPLNNDEVLAVAFEYTLNGETYQVGQFSTDGVTPPDALILKMLKSTITNPRIPIWDLMMKNVYTINAFQVNREEFALNVFYNNPETGVDINYIPVTGLDDVPLIRVLNADRLDANQAANPDGVFDFVDNADTEGGTIVSRNGRIFFPVIEPFGSHLEKQMLEKGVAQATIDKIAYKQLYDSTKIAAQQVPELNRFKLKGSYKSASGSEITLNALNIPQGSVVVTAGGVVLQENVDYTVDYNLGRVKIINQGLLESQTPIKIALESNSLFSVQQKTLIANRFDYRVNKDFNLGATIMNSSERPITQKVNYGDDPINNTIIGFDGNYSTEAPFLTRLVDALPFIETKEPSSIQVSGEFAQLIPGHSKAIGSNGNAYVDDFEGSQSTVDLRAFNAWTLASTPQGQTDLFPEGNLTNDLSYGYKRAKLNWFVIDPLFYRNNNLTPDNIDIEMQSNHTMREILEQEVFPNRQLNQGTPNNIAIFNLAYTPNQRGPYNYTPNLEPDGTMQAPEDNWAGIMRRVTTTNFENSNVEFIQFWIMDPFNSDSPNQTGGDLYFNLGNISEDVLKDSRKSFENGIPKDAADIPTQMDTTAWGLVPKKQSIINAFDNTDNSNATQDVGFDGLADAAERQFFANYLTNINGVVNPDVFAQIQADPSGDNYHYYRGTDYDNQALDILERYLSYNGFERNSPTTEDSPEDYTTSATTLPTTEDINLDNNLSEAESYFQYKVHLEPSQMQIGMNYITDIVEASPDNLPNGETKPVKWYQFKVPIRDPERSVGGIQDFRSIRFFRMFLKNFSQPVVMRFARLELIRGEWRKYLENIVEPGATPGDPDEGFDVTAVNIEENANRAPVNYVLPPGIQREIDAGTQNLRQINEQSLSIKVCSLEDGNAKGAYRNVEFDVRQYKKMRMYLHAETVEGGGPVDNGDVTVFIRLGSDFDQNYYEYEIPVALTQVGGSSVSDPNLVWPEANNVEIDFDQLKAVKLERNNAGFSVIDVYNKLAGKARIHVKGNPTLNDIRTIMIGVRNPIMSNNPFTDFDDGRSRCIEVWANELRLTDFNEQGGWAAVGRVNAKLADFANINVAGNISKPGWGSLESRVNERQQETRKGIDATSNFEMGKFLPEKTGIKIPMYLGYSEQTILPKFDPLNPDIELTESTRNLTAQEKRDRKNIAKTLTQRRSFNLTNVRKERTNPEKKQRFYDVENLSATYSYSETKYRDPNIEIRKNKVYKGAIAYGFQNKPKSFEPFKNVEFLNKKGLRLIKDFNIYTGIKQFAFNTSVDRSYSEQLVRNNIPGTLDPAPTFTKTFNWTRIYDFKYDLSKNLKFTFNANNQALIGEPAGRVDKNISDQYGDYDVFKDSVMRSIGQFGTTTDYNHALNVNYTWPTKKVPYLEWLDLNTTYSGSYNWQRSPLSQDTLGNTIQNNATLNWNWNMRMADLYTKIPVFDKVIKKKAKRNRNSIKSNLKKALGDKKAASDSTNTKKKPPKDGLTIGESFLSLVMSLKTMNITYSNGRGTSLPGFGEYTNVLGMNNQFTAPGLGFIVGEQRGDYPFYAAEQGWLKQEPDLNAQFTRVFSEKLNFRASLEPVKDLQLDLEASRDIGRNSAGFFRYNEDPSVLDWELQNPQFSGTYAVSVISIRSAFVKDNKDDFSNQVFQDLLNYRQEVSSTLGQERGTAIVDTTGFYDGYSGASQEVLITSFVAAYTGKSPGKVGVNPTGIKMAPNWRLSYDGLSKLPAIRKLMRSFTINHAYRSQYAVSYQTNQQAIADENLRGGANNDFLPAQQISTVTLNESFSPLLNFDITWNNSLITRFELKRDRQISLSLANQQITENKNKEYVIGLGYRFKNVKFPFKVGTKELKSDLNCRADISIRDNINIIRKINELSNEPTAGRRVISFKLSADYIVNQKVSIRAFFDRQITKPALSIPFPTYNTNAGVSVRLTLTQ